MNLVLNPLNSKTNSNEKVNIDEVTFWEFYYYFLNSKKKVLTNSEISFLAFYTTNQNVADVTKHLNMQKSNFYGMLKNLEKKNFVEKVDGVYQLHFNIRKLKEYLTKNKSSVTFTFPFNINYDS